MLRPGWMERSQLFRRRTFLQASAGWLGTHCLGLEPAKSLVEGSKDHPIRPRVCSPFSTGKI